MNKLLSHAHPVLKVHNIQDSLDFYKARLGFEVAFSEGVPTDHLILVSKNIQIHLSENHSPEDSFNTSTIYFVTDDIKLLYEAFKLKGLKFHKDLTRTEDGRFTFSIKDPDNHLIIFGTAFQV